MQDKEITMNELMDFLQENMATKEDLAGFATKDDLASFATKDDLASFATKEDLRIMEHSLRDALDDKLADLKGDLVVLMRKEDTKLVELIDVLRDKNVINKDEANRILGMQPFPQVSR